MMTKQQTPDLFVPIGFADFDQAALIEAAHDETRGLSRGHAIVELVNRGLANPGLLENACKAISSDRRMGIHKLPHGWLGADQIYNSGNQTALRALLNEMNSWDEVERYTSTPGQQLVQAARDWFILQATGSSTPPGGNIRPHAGLRGTSEGGVGSWERAPIRSGGVEYQEQICRVERGLEYYVEGVAFDGYDPARNVLLDSKDWRGYPPTDANFWEYKTLDEAVRQTNAARASGTQIEWVVATEQAATAIRRLFDRERIEINVVVVPKK